MKNLITLTKDFSIYRNSFEDKYDVSIDFSDEIIENNAVLEYIQIDLLVSPQEDVDEVKIKEIADSGYFDGAIGLRFKGSDEVCIIDGNHRINSAIKCGRTKVLVNIVNF